MFIQLLQIHFKTKSIILFISQIFRNSYSYHITNFLHVTTKQTSLSSNNSDLYFGSGWFKSWLGHQSLWLRFFVVFLNPFRQMAKWHCKTHKVSQVHQPWPSIHTTESLQMVQRHLLNYGPPIHPGLILHCYILKLYSDLKICINFIETLRILR
jgi:hypothetical protein